MLTSSVLERPGKPRKLELRTACRRVERAGLNRAACMKRRTLAGCDGSLLRLLREAEGGGEQCQRPLGARVPMGK